MVEATALADRIEFTLNDQAEDAFPWQTITAGFRRDGSLTVYLEQDPFYQFDVEGRLRRAFVDGFLYRSQTDTLARLHRERSTQQTTLLRYDLSTDECRQFRHVMQAQLKMLLQLLQTGQLCLRRIVSTDNDLPRRLCLSLDKILTHDQNFLSRSINRRR